MSKNVKVVRVTVIAYVDYDSGKMQTLATCDPDIVEFWSKVSPYARVTELARKEIEVELELGNRIPIVDTTKGRVIN